MSVEGQAVFLQLGRTLGSALHHIHRMTAVSLVKAIRDPLLAEVEVPGHLHRARPLRTHNARGLKSVSQITCHFPQNRSSNTQKAAFSIKLFRGSDTIFRYWTFPVLRPDCRQVQLKQSFGTSRRLLHSPAPVI